MNPQDELNALVSLFAEPEPLIARADHIPASQTPEPHKTLLAHDHHMTLSLESYLGAPVDVRVVDRRLDGDIYSRKIILLKSGTEQVVMFGIVRLNLAYVTLAVRDEILAERTPLGRVLIEHNVLREVNLGAMLRIVAGPGLARLLPMKPGETTYGRLATIFCNLRPAIDLLEITAPFEPQSRNAPPN